MKISKLVILLLLITFATSTLATTVKNYNFPISNRYLATISSVAAKSGATPYDEITLTPREDRGQVPLLEGQNKIKMYYYGQKHRAPLIFVMPGVGGDGVNSESAHFLAEQLYKEGHSTITIPNALSASYALAASSKGLPGYCPNDSKELYKLLGVITNYLIDEKNINISSFGYIGYSYGALQGAFLAKEDMVQGRFRFDRVLLINPPVDLMHGINTLDSYYEEKTSLSKSQKNIVAETTTRTKLLKRLFWASITDFKITRLYKFIIGDDFRESLKNLVFVGQQVEDKGILRAPATIARKKDRIEEAKRISFNLYIRNFVYPAYQEETGLSFDEFVDSMSIKKIMPYLKQHDGLYLFHNMDDFLLRGSVDTDYFESELGDHFRLYPKGGHLGNLWDKRNQADIKAVFSGLIESEY